LDPERLERCDDRSKETFLSIKRRSGTLVASLGLRWVIFRNSDFGECGSESLERTSAKGGLTDCCELVLEERYDDARDKESDGGTGVEAGSSSSVKEYSDGARASSGSGSSSSEALDAVVVTELIVSRDVRCRKCGGSRLLLRNDLSLAGERRGRAGGVGIGALLLSAWNGASCSQNGWENR
jgi:hypothetical protein